MPRDGPVGELRLRLGAFAAGWLAVFLQSFLTVGMRFWSVPVVFWTGLGLLAASLRILPTPDAPEADAPAASPPASSPAAAVKTCALVLVLLAAGTFFIVRGLRASLAMKQALRTEDLSERTALLRRASAESVFFVDRVRARNMLGRTLHEAGNPAAASDEFKSVLNLAGHYHDVELRLASTYLDRRRPEDAARHIESYGRLRPADTRTAGILVRYLTGLAPEEAVRTLNALVEKHPRCSKIRIAAGKVGLRMSPPDEAAARRHFAKAIEVNPDDPQAAYLVGIEQLKARHYPQARLLLKRSLEGGLRLPELYLNLSRVERMLGEPGRSRQLLEDGLKLFPDAAELKRELEGLV